MKAILALTLTVLLIPVESSGETGLAPLEKRIHSIRQGRVLMSFDARPGVHGDGNRICTTPPTDEWRPRGESGPVLVSLRLREGKVTGLRTYIGGEWIVHGDDVEDLGAVPAPEAARFLLSLASNGGLPAAEEAIFPATLADGIEVWPHLLDIARNEERPQEVRRSAVFWLGQEAAQAVTGELSGLVLDGDEDMDVREHAVFALSQRPVDEAVPALIRVARSDVHPLLREKALFWLAQKDDPRVLVLFEEILEAQR